MTLGEWHRFLENALSKGGVENARQEAKWLLAGALGREASFVTLSPAALPSPQEEAKIHEWLARRLQGEPLSRLKGVREFWSLPFQLNAHTLDPRPETELLVEGVLTWVGEKTLDPWRLLDLGTGSGCLLIALLHELKNARGRGVDLSDDALEMARLNAGANGVASRALFSQGHWGDGLDGPFDIIVSNPPYIPLKDKETLEKGVVNFDPSLALFAGEEGLDCYQALVPEIKRLLSPQGLAILEIGYGQRHAVESLFCMANFKTLFVLKDLAGIDRAIGFGGRSCYTQMT